MFFQIHVNIKENIKKNNVAYVGTTHGAHY